MTDREHFSIQTVQSSAFHTEQNPSPTSTILLSGTPDFPHTNTHRTYSIAAGKNRGPLLLSAELAMQQQLSEFSITWQPRFS
ncbi:hypothetical protein AB0E01_10935 [Nocardia vinacea]|uniref:hypothetical protein n=1 Tax=Nocardia vinacea TaxID=96468 RepID=UPI003404EA14